MQPGLPTFDMPLVEATPEALKGIGEFVTELYSHDVEIVSWPAQGSPPKMLGFQAEGAAPLVRGAPVENPETVATAIRIGKPVSWDGAIAAMNIYAEDPESIREFSDLVAGIVEKGGE